MVSASDGVVEDAAVRLNFLASASAALNFGAEHFPLKRSQFSSSKCLRESLLIIALRKNGSGWGEKIAFITSLWSQRKTPV